MYKTFTVRLSEEETAVLESTAHNEGVTKSDLIRQKIRDMSGPTSDLSEWL